jgi:phosphatidylinositol kinase/protein kinase (PI-3  family)
LDKIFNQKIWIEISKKTNARAYMEEVEAFAISGNPQCQELVAQWCIMTCQNREDPNKLKFLLRKAIEFWTMAAKSGVTSEALNLPISLGRLSSILTKEISGKFTDAIEQLSRERYRWSLRNSKNIALPKSEREQASKTAQILYKSMPELYEGI